MTSLIDLSCRTYAGDEQPLEAGAVKDYMRQLHEDWQVDTQAGTISRTFRFGNYYETMAFVNGVALVSHQQDHHPDMQVGYNRCTVSFSTHSIGGLSENDFICAAKIDRTLAL